jgi:rRNA processing protein Krr1/Pno1
MAPSLSNNKPLGLNAFQWTVIGVLGAALAAAIYLAGKGESVPVPLMLVLASGVSYIGFSVYNSYVVANDQSAEEAAKFFIRKQERKERKLRKKIELELARDAEKLEALQQKAIVTAKRRALNKAKAQAAALQKAAADAKKAAEEAEAALKVDSEGKKKKKKKKGKTAKKAAVAKEVVAEPAEPEETEVWEEVESKKAKWAARKKDQDPLAFVQQSSTDEEDYMEVPQKHYPVVIGSEGKTLAKIQEVSQCKVSLPKKGSGINVITFTAGSTEAIELAKSIINELISKGYSQSLDANMTDLKVKISNLGLLIGPSGENIRKIQSKTSTRIQLPPKGSEDGVATIIGESDNVVSAANAIKELLANGFCSLTHENWCRMTVGFPSSMIGILVGPKGENLNKMQSGSKCRINVPKTSKEDKTSILSVSVVGPEEGVEKVIAQIKSIQTDFVSKEIEFPATMLVPLIGPKGENIRRIQTETNTRINIEEHLWDPTLRSITIEGFKDKIGLVEAELAKIIENNSHIKVNFPAARLGALIGKKGESIRKLQDESGVRISVKDHEWDDTVKVVTIEGLSTNVEAAKVTVEGLAKAPKRPQSKKQSSEEEDADIEIVPVESADN